MSPNPGAGCSATAGGRPVMVVDFRCVGGQQQPAGVRRDRFEVPALGLGIDRAERQRRLARPGDTGEGDEGVAGRGDVDGLQVVHLGPEHPHVGVMVGAGGCAHLAIVAPVSSP